MYRYYTKPTTSGVSYVNLCRLFTYYYLSPPKDNEFVPNDSAHIRPRTVKTSQPTIPVTPVQYTTPPRPPVFRPYPAKELN